jgi:hypothetical protein
VSSRLLPHMSVRGDAVQWGNWWVELDGRRELVSDRLKGWDYSSQARFEIQPTVDVASALRSAGIADSKDVALLGLLDCRATGERFVAQIALSDVETGGSNLLALEPPAGSLADAIELSAHLVFTGVSEPNVDGRAWRPSSRLASSSLTRLRLEGDGARFPTEGVAFSVLGLDAAAWTLQFTPEDLADSFLGHVRLLLNTEHPAAALLLASDGAVTGALHSVLTVDVSRQMFSSVAHGDFELDPSSWSDGSVGHTLDKLAQEALSMDLGSVVTMARRDPLLLDRKLQVGFDFLRGLS